MENSSWFCERLSASKRGLPCSWRVASQTPLCTISLFGVECVLV
jgi:hypothetical protein